MYLVFFVYIILHSTFQLWQKENNVPPSGSAVLRPLIITLLVPHSNLILFPRNPHPLYMGLLTVLSPSI